MRDRYQTTEAQTVADWLGAGGNGCVLLGSTVREELAHWLVFDVPARVIDATVLRLHLVGPVFGSALRSPALLIAHGPLLLSLFHRYWLASEQRAYYAQLSFEYSCLA